MNKSVPEHQTYGVVIPSYNTGSILGTTVTEALRVWQPVWVVIDGSNDGSAERLSSMVGEDSGLNVIRFDENRGKGAAVIVGMADAQEAGCTHALVMDADGQHPAERIPDLIDASRRYPHAMILGNPIFSSDAPVLRKYGRRVGNWWTNLETLWGGIKDSMFGFRVYPIAESLSVLRSISGGRRFDFETQLAVRLYWNGVPPVNIEVPVKYLTPEQGGVTHFRYFRDNLVLLRAHVGLVLGAAWRIRMLKQLRRQSCAGSL
ncbi:MAG: glycosyltransferase family 2 protein [Verrucomicrobiia bacterium]